MCIIFIYLFTSLGNLLLLHPETGLLHKPTIADKYMEHW
jgi:hypothetical protein